MMRYRFIEHTADTGVVAYGATLAGAYANAAYGMFSIIADLRRVRQVEFRQVEIKEQDAEAMLFEWLNHLLYIFDVDQLLLKRFDIIEFDAKHLKATCYGEKIDLSRHRIKLGVKSATYHMLKVEREKKQVQVIFDV